MRWEHVVDVKQIQRVQVWIVERGVACHHRSRGRAPAAAIARSLISAKSISPGVWTLLAVPTGSDLANHERQRPRCRVPHVLHARCGTTTRRRQIARARRFQLRALYRSAGP